MKYFWGKISLAETKKNSQANESPGNDGLTVEFYKHFSDKLTPVMVPPDDSWESFSTIDNTSRTWVISAIYKNGDKKDIENYRLIIYNSILQIDKNQLAATENRTILQTLTIPLTILLSTVLDIIDVSSNNNHLIQIVVHRSNTCYSKIYQKGNWKNIRYSLEWKKTGPPRHLS